MNRAQPVILIERLILQTVLILLLPLVKILSVMDVNGIMITQAHVVRLMEMVSQLALTAAFVVVDRSTSSDHLVQLILKKNMQASNS